MPIPEAARPIVEEVIRGLAEVVGDIVLKVAKQQHPELDLEPVADAGAGMDRAREAALKRIADQNPPSLPPLSDPQNEPDPTD